jgi:hypothetical protein
MTPRFRLPHSLALLGVFATYSIADAATEDGKVSFNRDIRPILSDTCFQCHGFDEKERKAGLRLDVRESAIKPAESGEIAIVPGQPEQSALIARLTSKDRDEVMPPPKLHKTITPEQIELFRKWIAQGAEYQGHWAFLKPERPAVPSKSGDLNAIDAFIRERVDRAGLKPSPAADKPMLIRRASLDLTGIPPTAQEVAAFVADHSADAFEKVVDRLLASPRYGEHMAARWLDMARYADSNGFQSDTQRHMWPWRDWVISAFNRNLPFDQFTIEQLAGDLLPNATRDQIVATGFNRNHRLNGEGGRIVEEWFAETVIDRVETTGLTWMGLTFNCCRCHDHKYDPISQKEFYQFFAYFNSVNEMGVLDDFGGAGRTRRGGNSRPVLPLPTPEQAAQIAKLEKAVADATAAQPAARDAMAKAQAEWEPKFRAGMKTGLKPWTPVEPREVRSDGGAIFAKQSDGSWLATGINPPFDQYLTLAPLAEGTLSGLLLEVFPDPSLPNQSVGRYSNGNFVLTDVIVEVSAPGLAKPLRVDFTRAEADYNQKGYEVKAIVENRPKRGGKKRGAQGWAVDGPKLRDARKAMFIADAPVTVPPNATLSVTLRHDSIAGHNIGRFRLSTTGLPPATVKLDGAKVPPSLVAALEAKPEARTAAQKTELAKFFRENADNPMKRAESAVAAAKKALEAFQGDVINTMVMEELPEPRVARLLVRGEYDKPGDPVPRALPAVLPPMPAGAPNDRLGLAKWLVSGEHPLTARVWVNREWERFFGTGLVKTSENLGSQAEWPSHPELLDWLATEFVRLNWDMKAMQRLMVTSATYRQSSRVTPEHLAKDPENRLLARAPRLRLPAELLRDQALSVSGLLVEKVGGPSVRPYMPERVWDETSVYGDMRNYTPDTGEGLYRRTLYTIWKRTAPPPSMALFDSPAREICTVKRSRTNTPLQALSLLNEVTYVEAARAFAQRMIAEGGATPEARIAWAFQRATGREPRTEELAVLANGLTKRLAKFSTAPEAATQLTTVGASKPAANLPASELAAYTLTANVLLNLDEVVTRE